MFQIPSLKSLFILALISLVALSSTEYAESDQNPEMTPEEKVLQAETQTVDRLNFNYDHLQTVSFPIGYGDDYVVAVDTDHVVKGIVSIYWEEGGSYVESRYSAGEQVRMIVYEDGRTVVLNEVFYHLHGFSFQTKKGHDYVMKFFQNGKTKLAILNLENYLTEGKSSNILSTDHIGVHEEKTAKIKNDLESYLGIVQRNAVINDQIAENVRLHTKRYMWYQIFEMLVVVGATVGQVKFIQRLLSDNSVV